MRFYLKSFFFGGVLPSLLIIAVLLIFYLCPPLAILLPIAFAVILYIIPTIIARRRKHINKTAITVLNIVLGWSVIGYIVALVWACTNPSGVSRPAAPKVILIKCPNCSSLQSQETFFCSQCGFALQEKPKTCSNCGNAAEIEDHFCKACGRAL